MGFAERFAALFAGSQHYFIFCNPKRPKDKQNTTQYGTYSRINVEEHLAGKRGLGTSPLCENHTCSFAVIDIDVRDDADQVNFVDIAERVRVAGLPVVMARTRSGGAHLYLFLRKPAPAKLIRALIASWAEKLQINSIAGQEVDCLIPSTDYQQFEDDGTRHASRSVNLPYFNADDTERYAFAADGVTRLSFEQFLDAAEAARVEPSLLVTLPGDEYSQAPPCVQRLLKEGMPRGMRNESMTQIAIYLKRVDVKDVLPRLATINVTALDPSLPMDELKKITKSVTRRDYKYRCKTEPCKSLCDSATCVTRTYGIKTDEQDANAASDVLGDLPGFDDFVRVQDTELGGIYQIRINGNTFTATVRQLVNVRDAQILFVERVGIVLPAKLTFAMWYDFIMTHIRGARVELQAAEDTEHGALKAHLDDFIAGRLRQPDNDSTDDADVMAHRAKLDTAPILEHEEVLFRLMTFERYCRDKRLTMPATQMKTVTLMRKLGAKSGRLRTPAGIVGVWRLPYATDEHEQHYDEVRQPDPNHDY